MVIEGAASWKIPKRQDYPTSPGNPARASELPLPPPPAAAAADFESPAAVVLVTGRKPSANRMVNLLKY
jgi:hypothetical protein